MSNVKNLLVVLVLVVGSNSVAMDKKTNYKRSAHAKKVQGRQGNNFENYLTSLTAMSSGPKGATKAYFSERQEEFESYEARAGEPFEQIQEAKRKAQQDRMDMRVAANRLIKFLQDELRYSCAN